MQLDNGIISQIERPEFKERKQNFSLNKKEYQVSQGDTLSSIAFKNGITDYRDLEIFNLIVGEKSFKTFGKSGILIKPGEIIYVPNDIEKFYKEIEEIRKIIKHAETNLAVANGDKKILQRELNERIFPKRPVSIGVEKLSKGFLNSQNNEFDPILPRVVDKKLEIDATCSHFAKMFFMQAVSFDDMNAKEKKLLTTGNIHAWVFPSEAIKIGFEQKFNFMGNFSKELLITGLPVTNSKEKDYIDDISKMEQYLTEKGVPGSLLPIFFKYSKYKDDVRDYNSVRNDKHYNTHMSVFLGNNTWKFNASEVGEVKDGKIIPFIGEPKKLEQELTKENRKLEINKSKYKNELERLKTLFNIDNFPEIKYKADLIDRIIENRLISNITNIDEKNKKRNAIKELFNSLDSEKIRIQGSKLLGRTIKDEELDYIIKLQQTKNATYKSFEKIKQFLESIDINKVVNENEDSKFISEKLLSRILKKDEDIQKIINDFNQIGENINSGISRINELNETKKAIEKNEKLPTKKIAITDYLTNFVQQRADYSRQVLTTSGKKEIFEGLKKYSELVHIKVNGKEVDFTQEINKKHSEQIQISPNDEIELFGPMFLDGLHMNNSGEERASKMNSRTRFLFEYMANQSFTPSELLEPGEKSSFSRKNYENLVTPLEIKGVYDLRKGETLESKLKKQIPIFEKETFENLVEGTPEYEKKINYYYGLQIKALQLAGFIENENILNPGGTYINRSIPYFDTKDIDYTYRNAISNIKKQKENTNTDELKLKEYLELQLYPGDNTGMIFSRVLKSIEPYKNNPNFPNLGNIGLLNNYLKRLFLKEVFNEAYKSNKKINGENILSGKIPPGTKIIIPFVKLNQIIGDISSKASIDIYKGKITPIDESVINLVTPFSQNRSILKSVSIIESYIIPSEEFYKLDGRRLLGKKIKEIGGIGGSIGDFQTRLGVVKYKGWDDEWPKKEHLQNALGFLNTPEAKKLIDQISNRSGDNKDIIDRDLELVKKLTILVNKENPSKSDFEEIYNILVSLLRIDDGRFENGNSLTSNMKYVVLKMIGIDPKGNKETNIIGKIIGASLANDKLNSNLEKNIGMLESSGTNINEIINNPDKQYSFEAIVSLTYNLGESKILYGLTQNFLLRLIKESKILPGISFPGINVDYKGSIEYGVGTFKKHISYIHDKLALNKDIANNLSNEQLKLNAMLLEFCREILESENLNKTIYKFTSNEKLKELLAKNSFDRDNPDKKIDSSILPQKSEFSGDPFRNVFFGYITKASKVPTNFDNNTKVTQINNNS